MNHRYWSLLNILLHLTTDLIYLHEIFERFLSYTKKRLAKISVNV